MQFGGQFEDEDLPIDFDATEEDFFYDFRVDVCEHACLVDLVIVQIIYCWSIFAFPLPIDLLNQDRAHENNSVNGIDEFRIFPEDHLIF